MVTITRTLEIDAPVERVFSFMSNPNNLPEIWPSLVEVSNVNWKDDGSHSFDWTYKMAGIRFHGHADSIDVEKNKRVVSKNRSGIESKLEYLYEAVGNKTRFTMKSEYEIPGQLLSRLAEPLIRKINEHEADVLTQNLKARMELTQAPSPEVRASM
jgi:uncharacterized membrane protein